eukprot:5751165-Alexandrium_andersonii.AAC.1
MLHITGLEKDDGGAEAPVFALLVGAARWVSDFRGLRKQANAAFVINPGRGPNDGLISLVVRTAN